MEGMTFRELGYAISQLNENQKDTKIRVSVSNGGYSLTIAEHVSLEIVSSSDDSWDGIPFLYIK
jgi:hypothetical protein